LSAQRYKKESELTNKTSKDMENQGKGRIVIRVGRHHLSFSAIDMSQDENPIVYEPFVVKSGMSIAANLRSALKESDIAAGSARKVLVMSDSPLLLTPVELFEESTMAQFYQHAFPKSEQEQVMYNVLPDENTVAVFALNKDLLTVINDHFDDVKIVTALSPVFRHLHRRSFTGSRNKLYGYFHDETIDIFAFHQNRFKFYNRYDARRMKDVMYFMLYVWKQLSFSQENDELYIVGDIAERDLLTENLKQYVQKTYTINPSADFNRAASTQVKGMPFDLVTLFARGR
jgi:hypothetical protein